MSQETIAILAIGLPSLAGLVHIVWKLGDIGKDLAVVMERVKDHEEEIQALKKARMP